MSPNMACYEFYVVINLSVNAMEYQWFLILIYFFMDFILENTKTHSVQIR